MDIFFKFLSALGTALGAWAVIRSYWLTRSKLKMTQRQDKGHYSFQGNVWMLELFISNLSSQANSIVEWRAWLKNTEGTLTEMAVRPGSLNDSKTGSVDYLFNATPINVGPHSTISSHMTFYYIKQEEYASPLTLKIQAKDMYDKRYECWCKYPLPETVPTITKHP